MDFSLTPEQEAIRDAARSFAQHEIAPYALHFDETQEFPHDIFRKLGELGFLGIMVPPELSGSGMGYVEYALIVEEIAKACPAVALGVAAHNGLCTGHILQFGSIELQQKYIPRLARGETMGAWGLTEPGSGSDAGGMLTTAVRDGQDWILNGSKNFITHGNVGDIAVILAITDRNKGNKGISAFVVDKSMHGFYASKKENKLGMRCSDTASLVLDNVRVPASHMLGNEGEGFIQALQILDGGRISIAALGLGLAEAALTHSIQYAKTRKQFGKPLAEMQAIQFKLAEMSMNIEAARLLTFKAAWMKDNGMRVTLEAAQAKMFASEVAVAIAEDAIQIHGGYGYTKEYPVEKLWRDAKLLTIGEGTSEVQRMVIARNILAL
ncbi:MAG: acyl-CoA dehydrogenase family protein [Bacteroidota bacterium]|nr:acyl-CoA dehydrogenase family protein [Candidatus Kapabacteria bacterium]MDW8219990.1 acyl-CoA dehydrogenase family protein [Bacteroidota bacterium]